MGLAQENMLIFYDLGLASILEGTLEGATLLSYLKLS
jgi:hypothetical protein